MKYENSFMLYEQNRSHQPIMSQQTGSENMLPTKMGRYPKGRMITYTGEKGIRKQEREKQPVQL